MACPDVIDLEMFASNALDDATRASVDQHVAGCPMCSEEIKQLIENLRLASALRSRKQSDDAAPLDYEPDAIGPYRIVRKLGQGGMGAVYEAEQENPRRVVAVKVLRQGLVSAAMLSRFRREVHTLGRLRHPGIAQIYDAGTHVTPYGPQPYFVMELVRGPSIRTFAESKKLNARQRLELVASICDAVEHAHRRGVIHRDLKPDNILVDESGSTPQPKILDFGVARVVDPDAKNTATLHTTPGQIVGTVAYMSPEQASAADPEDVDPRADVYALGVICFELLSGRLPYHLNRGNIADSIRAIVQDEPTQLSTLDRSLRGDVSTIVAKALEKEKSRRYQTAAEMAADIRHHLHDEPILAHAPSTIYQLRKFARRNKGLVAGVAAAFVLLILGVIGTSIGMVNANRAKLAADRAKLAAIASAAEAKSESNKKEGVNQFLREMLSAADPRNLTVEDRARGRGVTVVDVMNGAAEKIKTGTLKDHPDVEIAVRNTLGGTYFELGEYARAEEHLQASLDLARKMYGAEHVEIANNLNGLAVLHQAQGKLEQTERELREALAISTKLLGEDDIEVSTCLNNLAQLMHGRGKFAEAETLNRKSLAIRRKLYGEEHRSIAVCLNNLGLSLDEQGRRPEAEEVHRQALAMRRKLLGDDHPEVATSLNNLAYCVRDQGKLADAEVLFRESLAMRQRTYEPGHPVTASALNSLGSVLQSEGKLDECEPFYREALAMQRKSNGDRPNTTVAMTVNNLGTLLRDRGKFAEAEVLFRESLAMRQATLEPGHPSIALAMSNLASVLLPQNKLAEAEPLIRESLAMQSKARGESHPFTASGHTQLGSCLIALGKFEDAEKELLIAQAVLEPRLKTRDRMAIANARGLVKLYETWNKPEEARRFVALLATTRASTQPATQSAGKP